MTKHLAGKHYRKTQIDNLRHRIKVVKPKNIDYVKKQSSHRDNVNNIRPVPAQACILSSEAEQTLQATDVKE